MLEMQLPLSLKYNKMLTFLNQTLNRVSEQTAEGKKQIEKM